MRAAAATALALSCALAVSSATAGTAAYADARPPGASGRPLPAAWHGVTTERVGRLDRLVASLGRHRVDPFVRVVFQADEPPAAYADAVRQIRREAYVLGLPFDSTATAEATVADYRSRVRDYVRHFGSRVDLWEIGNELNGEWVGDPADIRAKVTAAYDVVEREHADARLRSAITLNYWPSDDCYAEPWERTLPFARRLPARVRRGVDVVLLSFYETACSPRAHPTNRQFVTTFRGLTRIFPRSQVGMGEIGAQGRADGLPRDPTLAEKRRVAERYYGLHAVLRREIGKRYVGGYFWWYYHQDVVTAPRGRSLFSVLDRLFGTY